MDRILLLGTLKKLLDLPFEPAEYNVPSPDQEYLDFLAMVAGIKPVFLAGRGFDDPRWTAGVIDIARKVGLRVLTGPIWNAKPERHGLPAWFVAFSHEARGGDAVFICRDDEIAATVQAALDGGPVTVADEARLLGYPACCVEAAYYRDECLDHAYYEILKRASGGDEDRMRRLIDEDAQLAAETPEEDALLETAGDVVRAPFTSIHMCPACRRSENSPARKLSQQYRDLAYSIDRSFAGQLARGPVK